MKSQYIIFATLLCLAINANAQAPKQSRADRNKWLKEVREYKHEKLVEETDMSVSHKADFLFFYSAMEQEIYQVNVEARNLENKISNSTDEINKLKNEKAAETLAEVKSREGDIELKYYKKFEKILSKKQLFLLKRAENRFTRDMLTHNRIGKSLKTK